MTKIPTFGYKGLEAKLFELEPGEGLPDGWIDHPTQPETVAVAEASAAPEPPPDMPVISELDALRADAESKGIAVDKRWGKAKLIHMIQALGMDDGDSN